MLLKKLNVIGDDKYSAINGKTIENQTKNINLITYYFDIKKHNRYFRFSRNISFEMLDDAGIFKVSNRRNFVHSLSNPLRLIYFK